MENDLLVGDKIMNIELEEAIKTAIQGCNVQLYDIQKLKENKTNILRVTITSKDGVSLEKCTEVSRMISPILDIYEPMNSKYNLEVSSPGIERKLKKLEHFYYSIGENVKIKDYTTDTTKGKLLEVDDNGIITIQTNDNDIVKINFNDILSASTYFVWK